MEISEILKKAAAAVDESGVPEDLRAAAFTKAVELLSPAAAEAATSGSDAAQTHAAVQHDSSRLGKIASAFEIPIDQLDRIFDEFQDELQFTGDVGALGKTQSARVAELALLVGAGRQIGGYDEGVTTDAAIRAEVDRHGLLDISNYTKHIAPLKPFFNINGSGKSASFKLKYDGRVRAKQLAQALVGS